MSRQVAKSTDFRAIEQVLRQKTEQLEQALLSDVRLSSIRKRLLVESWSDDSTAMSGLSCVVSDDPEADPIDAVLDVEGRRGRLSFRAYVCYSNGPFLDDPIERTARIDQPADMLSVVEGLSQESLPKLQHMLTKSLLPHFS